MSHQKNLASFSTMTQDQLLALLRTKALILLVTENFNLLSKSNCLVAPISVRKASANMDENERSRKTQTYQNYAVQCVEIIKRLDEEHLNKAAELQNSVVTDLIDTQILTALLTSGIPLTTLDSLFAKLRATRHPSKKA